MFDVPTATWQEASAAASAVQVGNFSPAKEFVWKHKAVAGAVLLLGAIKPLNKLVDGRGPGVICPFHPFFILFLIGACYVKN